jgi:hypothetical protein
MTQADCVYITPPTNTPVDTTRRRFLAIAAGAGSLAAVALAPATAGPATLHDPVFGLIEAHRTPGRRICKSRPDLCTSYPGRQRSHVRRRAP